MVQTQTLSPSPPRQNPNGHPTATHTLRIGWSHYRGIWRFLTPRADSLRVLSQVTWARRRRAHRSAGGRTRRKWPQIIRFANQQILSTAGIGVLTEIHSCIIHIQTFMYRLSASVSASVSAARKLYMPSISRCGHLLLVRC